MVPLLIAGIVAAAAATAQGVHKAVVNNQAQKRNREKLDELLVEERSGEEHGLTPETKRAMTMQLNTPVQAAAQQGQNRAEQIQAAVGGEASGADVGRLRTEEARINAKGAQDAAMAIFQADELKKVENKNKLQNEIEQRIGMQTAMKNDDVDSVYGGIAQGASTMGQTLGAPPGTGAMQGGAGVPPSGPSVLPNDGGMPGGAPPSSYARSAGPTGGEADAPKMAAQKIAGAASPTTNAGALGSAGSQAFANEADMKDLYHMAKKHPELMAQMYVNRMESTRRIS